MSVRTLRMATTRAAIETPVGEGIGWGGKFLVFREHILGKN